MRLIGIAQRFIKEKPDYFTLAIVLCVALVHGLVYVFIVPPWQHYDEPNHFEYAWLIANRHRLPAPTDSDREMRWAVAQSMIEHGFFKGRMPAANPKDNPISIGVYSQLSDPPLYYIYASLPLWVMDRQGGYGNIYGQLIATRFMSLLLFLITIWISWGVAGELFPPNHPLRWLVPLCLALLPGFVDLMTALNNDVGAITLMSAFLWGAVRLVQRGFSLKIAILTAIFALMSFWTKPTGWVALPLCPIALMLSVLRGRWKWLVWGTAGLVGIVAIGASLYWGNAAGWYRQTLQETPTRISSKDAPVGKYVFTLTNTAGDTSHIRLAQFVPKADIRQVIGKRVTLGAWIWADQPVEQKVAVLQIYSVPVQYYQPITLTTTPTFYAFTVELPENTGNLVISLSPFTGKSPRGSTVFFDGVLLVKGRHPSEEPPLFSDSTGRSGVWAGAKFTNLLNSGSAEESWPSVNPIVDHLAEKIIPDRGRLSFIIYSILDRRAGGPYYQLTLRQLFWTFWAKFGWGNVYLVGHKPYRLIGLLTYIGLAGLLVAAWRYRGKLPWHLLLFLAITILVVWALTFLRGVFYIIYKPYIPNARYTYPAIIPVMLGLNTGWLGWVPEQQSKFGAYFIVGIFLILDIVSVYSLLSYY